MFKYSVSTTTTTPTNIMAYVSHSTNFSVYHLLTFLRYNLILYLTQLTLQLLVMMLPEIRWAEVILMTNTHNTIGSYISLMSQIRPMTNLPDNVTLKNLVEKDEVKDTIYITNIHTQHIINMILKINWHHTNHMDVHYCSLVCKWNCWAI
jgi:hypothetical protein